MSSTCNKTVYPLTNVLLRTSRRYVTSEFDGKARLRPLHTSPILRRPQRRDFSSSIATLLNARSESRSIDGEGDEGIETEQTSKRKTSRLPATKTSLRRVAVEAQRSKAGKFTRETKSGDEVVSTTKLVTAYAVAETFDLAKVVQIFRENGYEPDPLKTGLYPQVVHVQVPISSIQRSSNRSAQNLDSSETGDIFVFPSGTVVTWALPKGFASYFAIKTLLPAAQPSDRGPTETEDLEFIEDSNREHSTIKGETIILGTRSDGQQHSIDPYQTQTVDTVLTKIAFSSGFARSTKLAVLETNLSTYLASTASIPALLSKGSRLPMSISRRFILRKTGQLLLLRAQLNLYSELTDSLPDIFWDSRHELQLENYYDQVGRALDVGIRIKVLNQKMDYANEMATVLRERLSEKHGLFLEWTIIILITIEVAFGTIHLQREGFWKELWHNATTNGQIIDKTETK